MNNQDAAALLAQMEAARAAAARDPFGNPVLSIALLISARITDGSLDIAGITALLQALRNAAFDDRAQRLAAYVGGVSGDANDRALSTLAQRLVRPDPQDSPVPFAQFRDAIGRTRFSAVFTAHPTFAMPAPVLHVLAERACGRAGGAEFPSHRPAPISLEEEFTQAVAAIDHGRDAIDRLTAALLAAARSIWPDRWATLVPRPVTLASWAGYDTDGRTDIHWWDTLRLRLRMKQRQLQRLHAQLSALAHGQALAARVADAADAVAGQIAAVPTRADAAEIAAFARVLVADADRAIPDPAMLEDDFQRAIAIAEDPEKLALCVARAGLFAHGMALAHTHTRLNSTQLHNAVRQRLGIADPPGDPSHRRNLLASINLALDQVQPVPVDFGALLAEQASAVRLMMVVAQITKHIDRAARIRFLIAETETGYTLLAALWLARLFGIETRIEISPLFETAEALEHGGRVLEEALRSPHYRAYLRATGRLALQFGYSDSGRYVGQLAASYLIERLRLKVVEAMQRHGLTDIELVLFDTHGESIGRGAHPGRLEDRLKYLSPGATRQVMRKAGLRVREESSFQGGEGYLLFGTPELALASIARIAAHAFAADLPLPDATADPIYEEPDFAGDFFTTIGSFMHELVEDAGYAALLGAFGPALLDPSGSRPAARQTDGLGGPAVIRHPRELRAIPNNAILQQLGWCANTLQGLGAAASRQPELFRDMRLGSEVRPRSRRFARALDLAAQGLAHSDLYVLRAVISLIDPGPWLDRAAQLPDPAPLVGIARAVERMGLWAPALAMFRRIQADHLALRSAWPEAPRMASRELLLHALRVALIERIWRLGAQIPDFSPRHGVTRQGVEARILRLDIPAVIALLAEIFPSAPDPAAAEDYAEPPAPREGASYGREHAAVFLPMRQYFDLVREIGTAITHENGAFG